MPLCTSAEGRGSGPVGWTKGSTLMLDIRASPRPTGLNMEAGPQRVRHGISRPNGPSLDFA